MCFKNHFHTHCKCLVCCASGLLLAFQHQCVCSKTSPPTSPQPSKLILFCLLAFFVFVSMKISGLLAHCHLPDYNSHSLVSPHLPLVLTSCSSAAKLPTGSIFWMQNRNLLHPLPLSDRWLISKCQEIFLTIGKISNVVKSNFLHSHYTVKHVCET